DDAALRFAFKPYPPARARSVLVRDTAHLELMYVSEALESDVAAHPALERVGDYRALEFDSAGRLVAFE
ncbi:MAG TPA: DUF2088 domain-containing protein, partial [Dehalococcoidia bacterium]|nr:DUF2088 domain-containing protein [Dehalococcoidia bacterium]